MNRDPLVHERQQMLMRRPWDAAGDDTMWEISGDYPNGGTFVRCLAMTVPEWARGIDTPPLFVMISPAMAVEPVSPSWITSGRELDLVYADTREPYEHGGVA